MSFQKNRTSAGLWAAVSSSKRMEAVFLDKYEADRLIGDLWRSIKD